MRRSAQRSRSPIARVADADYPTPCRKLRIFVEWTWGRFVPTDITHLRIPGSQAVNAAKRHDRGRVASSLPARA